MIRTSISGRFTAMVAAVVLPLVACGDTEDGRELNEPAGAALPLYVVGPEPTAAIGVVEGDPDYMFEEVVSVRRLPGGSLAVGDAGDARITLFGPDGVFRRSFAGRGEGPGELRGLARLYPHGPDSILAADASTGSVSVFDTAGVFGRTIPRAGLSSDSTFALDVWLYGPFWVEGPITPGERARATATLDRLPAPTSVPPRPAYRRVLAAPDGELWISEPGAGPAGLLRWVVVGRDGAPVRAVDIPSAFAPMEIGRDEILGRWLGESDVNFVRAYDLADTGRRVDAPAWLAAGRVPAAADSAPEPDDDAFMPHVVAALRSTASAQEIGYSRTGTYTTEIDSLELQLDEGVRADVVSAHNRGWSGVFGFAGSDRVCGLGFGSATPPGWRGGMVACSRPRSSPAADGD